MRVRHRHGHGHRRHRHYHRHDYGPLALMGIIGLANTNTVTRPDRAGPDRQQHQILITRQRRSIKNLWQIKWVTRVPGHDMTTGRKRIPSGLISSPKRGAKGCSVFNLFGNCWLIHKISSKGLNLDLRQ